MQAWRREAASADRARFDRRDRLLDAAMVWAWGADGVRDCTRAQRLARTSA